VLTLLASGVSPCIECGACVKVCPVDLDPRWLGEPVAAPAHDALPGRGDATPGPRAGVAHEGAAAAVADDRYGDAECIRCGDCVEACRMIFKGRKGETPPLRFGRPGAEDRDARPTPTAAPTVAPTSARGASR
jgi:ferredoxin